jgi:small-conductance mechanosensitive channel
MDWSLLAIPGAALVRSVAGWLENALEDEVISDYEWRQLGATIFRVGVIGIAAAYGLDLQGFEAAGVAILGDFVLTTVKKFSY